MRVGMWVRVSGWVVGREFSSIVEMLKQELAKQTTPTHPHPHTHTTHWQANCASRLAAEEVAQRVFADVLKQNRLRFLECGGMSMHRVGEWCAVQ